MLCNTKFFHEVENIVLAIGVVRQKSQYFEQMEWIVQERIYCLALSLAPVRRGLCGSCSPTALGT